MALDTSSLALSLFKEVFRRVLARIMSECTNDEEVTSEYLLRISREELAEKWRTPPYSQVLEEELTLLDKYMQQYWQGAKKYRAYYNLSWDEFREDYSSIIHQLLL